MTTTTHNGRGAKAAGQTSITNLRGRTFRLGQRVTHTQGWQGVIFKIANSRLYVMPDDLAQVPAHEAWKLAKPLNGQTHFVRSRDHGSAMGNFVEAH